MSARVLETLFLVIGGLVMILAGLGLKALEMEVYGLLCVSVLFEILKLLCVHAAAGLCVCLFVN